MKTAAIAIAITLALSATTEAASRAYNLSARGFVGLPGSDNVLIGGIIVGEPPDGEPCEDGGHDGKGPILFAVRALGDPSLSPYLSSVRLLPDPQIDFYNSAGELIFSQKSYLESTPEEIAILSSYGLIPSSPEECAKIVALLPGYYTAIVHDEYDTGYGIALLEIYKLAR